MGIYSFAYNFIADIKMLQTVASQPIMRQAKIQNNDDPFAPGIFTLICSGIMSILPGCVDIISRDLFNGHIRLFHSITARKQQEYMFALDFVTFSKQL